jgi:hypothetical protein
MINVNYENIKNLCEKGKIILVASTISGSLLLSGCSSAVATNSNISIDIIDTTSNDSLENGVTQILDVPGEDFKLVVNYRCDLSLDEKWTITSDKDFYTEINTLGLDKDTEVYIDNIHTDTSICSYYPSVDGVVQDSMDDRIHNSLMMGFPISDDNSYVGFNEIEGENESFISGFYHGVSGYSSGTITEKRYTEEYFLYYGVYANKIASVIDLIIVDGDETRCVSVPSKVQVSVWPYIKYSDGTYKYFYYNEENGKVESEKIDEDTYNNKVNNKTYTK